MTDKNQEFIKSFQKLETLLKQRTNSSDGTPFKIAFKKAALRNSYIQKNYGLIEDLYALRNVFSHRERGKYIAEINETAIDSLDRLIKNLIEPLAVLSKFGVKVYQTNVYSTIYSVMSVMEEKVYTHVPVWNESEKILIGVFSYTSFFFWLAARQKKEDSPKFSKKTVGDINRKYLNSPVVNYKFIKEDTGIYEILPIWDKHTKQRKRLDCILITKSGKRNEKISGIITSWDLGAI